LHTSQLQETLDGGRGDDTGTAGSGDETDSDGTTLAGLLGGQRVRLTEVGAPVATADGEDGQLRNDDGSADGSSDFLGGLDAETNVTLGVADDNNGLESSALTGASLLLDRLDLYILSVYSSLSLRQNSAYLHNLILKLGEEPVNDLVLLDGQRV
jgi:hypothetical protein